MEKGFILLFLLECSLDLNQLVIFWTQSVSKVQEIQCTKSKFDVSILVLFKDI